MTVSKLFRAAPGGMTVPEIIIYIFVVGAVMAALGYFVADTIFGRTRAVAALEIQENARLAMDRVTNEIREARAVDTTSSSFDVNLALPANAGKMLKLIMASSTLEPTEFDVASGVLRIRQGASATATPLTANAVLVSNLTFHYYPIKKARNVGVELQIGFAEPNAAAYSTSTYLRTSTELRNR